MVLALLTGLWCILFSLVQGARNYKEDRLYMLPEDTKIIRLKDFLRSSINTIYTFSTTEKLFSMNQTSNSTNRDPNNPVPMLRIFQSAAEIYKIDSNTTSMNVSMQDIIDIQTGADGYYSARTNKSSYILIDAPMTYSHSNNSSLIKGLMNHTYDSHQTYNYFVNEGGHYYFFLNTTGFSAGQGKQILLLQYHFLDPYSFSSLMQSRLNISFEGKVGMDFNSFKMDRYYKNSTSFHFLGYREQLITNTHDCQFFFCSIYQNMQTMNWTGGCKRYSFTSTVNSTFSIVLTALLNETTVRMVAKNGTGDHDVDYFKIDCLFQPTSSDEGKAECTPGSKISTITTLQSTINEPLDLGGGHLGIWTEQYLLHSADLDYTRFDKVYFKIGDPKYLSAANKDMIAYSYKNSELICIGIKPDGKNGKIKEFYIVDYKSNPPEASKNDCFSNYIRLQKNMIFLTHYNETNGSLIHKGIAYRDAYVELKGGIVEDKMTYQLDGPSTDTLEFNITAKGEHNSIQVKNFSVVMLKNPLEVVELAVPFSKITLIEGAAMTITVKEDYALGNDVALNVTSSQENVNVSVSRNEIFKLTFGGTYGMDGTKIKTGKTGSTLHNLTVDNPDDFYTTILLWDNMILIGYRNYGAIKHTLYLCFVSNLNETNPVDKSAFCHQQTEINLNQYHEYEVKNAFLLNFNHMIIVMSKVGLNTDNVDYIAIIYDIDEKSTLTDRKLSNDVTFRARNIRDSFILYTYPGSAFILAIEWGQVTTQTPQPIDNLLYINFYQSENNRYHSDKVNITFDRNRIKGLDRIYPDYSTKHFFYIELRELGDTDFYYCSLSVNKKDNQLVGFLQPIKKLANSQLLKKGSNFCGAKEELVSVGKDQNHNNQTLFASPFRSKYPIHEQMMRRLPFGELNLENITATDCMNERNAMMVLAQYNSSKLGQKAPVSPDLKHFAIVNYDFDDVQDPRSRVETLLDLHNINVSNSNFLTLSARGSSSIYKDYVIVSYKEKDMRYFKYIEQPVRIFKFNVNAPQSSKASFDLSLKLFIPHSPSNVSHTKVLKVDVRPLEYSTKISVDSSKRIPKVVNVWDIEKQLMKIKGHLYDARLYDRTTGMPYNNSKVLQLNTRLKETERFSCPNAVSVREVGDVIFVRVTNGNVDVYYDKKNRSAKLTINTQSNYMEANLHPDIEFNSNQSLPHNKAYLVTGEDVRNGIRLAYYEMDFSNTTDPNKIIYKNLSYSIQGIYSSVSVLFCGSNLYIVLTSAASKNLYMGQPKTNVGNVTQPGTMNANVTLNLDVEIANIDLFCMADGDKNANRSLAIAIFFKNQSQILYNFKNETEEAKVPNIPLTFFQNKDYFVVDLECELSETLSKVITPGVRYLTNFKCFYSTRWADDYVVEYQVETYFNTIKLAKHTMLQEIDEVKNFEAMKTIKEGNYIIVVGENLKEPTYNRSYYFIIYKFTTENTYVQTFFKIKKNLDININDFKSLFAFGSRDNSIVYLNRETDTSNTFDSVYRYEIDNMVLNISSTNFNPNNIDLEILDLSGEVQERLNLINLIDMNKEINSLTVHPFQQVMGYTTVIAVLLLLTGFLFYYVMNRIYNTKKASMKAREEFGEVREMMLKQSQIYDEVPLDDEDSDEILEEMMYRAQQKTTK